MLAVMLVGAASILLIPFIDSLWLIVLILAVVRAMGAGRQRAELRPGDRPGAQSGATSAR